MAKKAPALKKPDLTPEQKKAQEWLSGETAEPQPPREKPAKMAKKTATKKKSGAGSENKPKKLGTTQETIHPLSVKEIADKLKFNYRTIYQALKKPGEEGGGQEDQSQGRGSKAVAFITATGIIATATECRGFRSRRFHLGSRQGDRIA